MLRRDVLEKALSIGCSKRELLSHIRRFEEFKDRGFRNQTFEILDSCRIDNGRIIPFSVLEALPVQSKHKVASFIPAAGSSSRFLKPLFEMLSLLREGKSIESILDPEWGLPFSDLSEVTESALKELVSQPKAYFKAAKRKGTFLEEKCKEHLSVPECGPLVFVCPKGQSSSFKSLAAKYGVSEDNVFCFEQDEALSTLRLRKDGSPFENRAGDISLAPAGHGSILSLFPKLAETVRDIDTLFIKNVDNLVGTSKETIEVSQLFLNGHGFFLSRIKSIRAFLSEENFEKAAEVAEELLHYGPNRDLSKDELKTLDNIVDGDARSLWTCQFLLFQTPVGLYAEGVDGLRQIFNRPFNILGQVPNNGTDVGGTPTVINSPQGPISVSLELPHVPEEDLPRLHDPKFATHFNPVFVAAELPQGVPAPLKEEHPFWLFAKKEWEGEVVYYHESILYELLGNTKFCNTLFWEVSRTVFNPHKTLDDTKV